MLRFPGRFVLSGAVCALLVVVGLAAWGLAARSSDAQAGTMHNCPPPSKWSIAVWQGASGTAAGDALAACGAGSVAAAYSLDSQTGAWSRWFAGKPEVSNLPPLNDMQGVLALGSATGPTATATPAATPTHTPTPAATQTPAPKVFTGQGDKTTSVFSADTWSFTVKWTTASDDPEWAGFSFYIYPEGETGVHVCDADFDGVGSDSTTCYAGQGDFYAKVLAANLTSWKLEIKE